MEKLTHRPKPEPDVKRRCHRCAGSGRAPCSICNGSGQVVATTDLRGKPVFTQCGGCFGLKSIRCSLCGGTGFL